MPYGTSGTPAPKPHMVKTHEGVGNHKTIYKTNAAASGSSAPAPTNQPKS